MSSETPPGVSPEAPPKMMWCTGCGADRREDEFGNFQNGSRRKTCERHNKRRRLEETLDSWPDFVEELKAWNHPDQKQVLHVKKVFPIHTLPAKFGCSSPWAPSELRVAQWVVERLMASTGFRFRLWS
ncbi:uncharacterized protein BROUX77_005609 [Berkeleyomyces rouxiae]|uniref:uncharacterized protein n=1 Tax=Berkeleyomyces rouxiae TaxID=2035830 RepID=UPI003B79A978